MSDRGEIVMIELDYRLGQHRWWRAIRGGLWERSAQLGWYKHNGEGNEPPGTIDSEDNRCVGLLVFCYALLVGIAVAVLAIRAAAP